MNKFKFSDGIWWWMVDDDFRNKPRLTQAPIPDQIPMSTYNMGAVIDQNIREDGIVEIPNDVRIVNCSPRCSAAWPDKEHGPCRGTGMFARIVDNFPQNVDK